ncbi:hypothetical protein PYCC9005_001341 [Savitreella phatthalungensis]
MPLPCPFPCPPLPQTDLLSFLFDRPPTDYPPETVILQDYTKGKDGGLTWRELRRQTRLIGRGLREVCGVKAGDRVLIYTAHGIHYAACMYGSMCAGAALVPINPMLGVADILHYIRVSGARVMIVSSPFLNHALEVKAKVPDLHIVLLDSPTTAGEGTSPHTKFTELLSRGEMDWDRSNEVRERVAVIAFSSGTSGLPKAVTVLQKNLVTNAWSAYHASNASDLKANGCKYGEIERKIKLGAFPPFHIAGIFSSMVEPIFSGGAAVFAPSFDLVSWLGAIGTYKAQALSVAPPIVLALATSPVIDDPRWDFSSVDTISVGAAPLSSELAAACTTRLIKRGAAKDLQIFQTYGMTEATCCVTFFDRRDNSGQTHAAVGYPMPYYEIKLVPVSAEGCSEDERQDHVEVRPGERGELLIRGPGIVPGYLGIDNSPFFDREGYYRTGDVGVATREGLVTIVDRIKELIKASGFQVAPAEVESTLLTHDEIVDAAVVGVTLPRSAGSAGSEMVRAYVSLRPGSKLDKLHPELARKRIAAWYDEQLPKGLKYKRLTGGVRIVKLGSIPKSPSGKILRRILRDAVKAEQAKDEQERKAHEQQRARL